MNTWDDEIIHSGRKRQKWGVQNGPPYPLDREDLSAAEARSVTSSNTNDNWSAEDKKKAVASANQNGQKKRGVRKDYASLDLRRAKKQYIDKWGTDSKHNILYISGISGSGKSTIASSLKNDKTNVIHLDSYFELKNIKNAKKNREPEFDIFLAKNKFNPDTLSNNTLFHEDIKGYFKKVDEFTSLTEKFGREQYSKNKRVIMEGVQLVDETMYPSKTFFDDKPCIRTTTDVETSRKRANDRDSIL